MPLEKVFVTAGNLEGFGTSSALKLARVCCRDDLKAPEDFNAGGMEFNIFLGSVADA